MESRSMRSKIAALSKGGSLTFNLKDVNYSTIRAYSYSLAVETGNTYSTSVNRQERILTITRTA